MLKHNKDQVTARSLAGTQEFRFIQQGDNILIPASDLYKVLKVQTKFSMWFNRRVEKYGFKEGFDFFPNLGKSTGGRQAVDYLLTFDMCKELGMLEETQKGREIRLYFIQKEKEARGISQLPKESQLFKGLKARRINGRIMYPYREIIRRCGYSTKSSSSQRKARYWNHFVLDGTLLYITEEFATHLYHSRQVSNNRATMLATQPVLPLNFGDVSLLNKGGYHG